MDEGVIQVRIRRPETKGGRFTVVRRTMVEGIEIKVVARGVSAIEASKAAISAAEERIKKERDRKEQIKKEREDLLS